MKYIFWHRLSRASVMDNTNPGHASRRGAIIDAIVARTGIDEIMIETLVRGFYQRVLEDSLLGPIFTARIGDWEAHITKMCGFWSSVVLMSGRYHGQPMTAHLALPVDTPHFDRWLAIFAATAQTLCPPAAAALFIERAHRIADSLELGIAAHRGEIKPRRGRSAQTFAPPRPASP
jgi:hemoglobin